MTSRSPRSLLLAALVLAGTVLALPWTTGGRSPTGQALAVLLPLLAAGPIWLAVGPGLRRSSAALALGLAVLAASSAAQTIYPDRTIQSLLLLLGYTATGAAAACCARSVPWARRALLGAIVLSGLAGGLAGTLQLLRGADVGLYANQLTGPFGYPNAMAGCLLLAAGAGATLAADRGPLALRLAALGSAGLLAAGMWLTGSRGAGLALGLGGAAGLLAAMLPGLRRPALAVGAGTLALGAAGAVACFRIFPLPAGWTAPAQAADTSILWRWHLLRWTWDMIREHPWLGVGPGGFPVALTHYQRLPYVSGENPHNLLAQVAAEFGLPVAMGVLAALGILLARMTSAVAGSPAERRSAGAAALLATLVAFLVHSLLDMAWSFPAVATMAAILCGLGAATVPEPAGARSRRPLALRIGVGAVLAVAMVLALTRFYASTLVGSGQQAFAFGASALAIQHLTWALRLNPASLPAHRWLAHARLREGDTAGALAVAEGAVRLAPDDPNGSFLAGEIAAASGQWARADRWFQAAALRAPFSQLRFHARAVEAAARAGDAFEARRRYEAALAAFSPDHVVDSEARCLAPGDRYLLARMSRIAAGLYRVAGDHAQEQEAESVARRLAEPDTRGICAVAGREGQASPELAMVGFWAGLGRGGWREAERFVAPSEHHAIPEPVRQRWAKSTQGFQPTVAWVAALSGNESQATLTVELLAHGSTGQPIRRCARGSFRVMNRGWFLEELPQVFPNPCTP